MRRAGAAAARALNDQPKKRVKMDVPQWLGRLGLEQYSKRFEEAGYDDVSFCAEMTMEDVLEIEQMLKPHAKRIIKAAKELTAFEYPQHQRVIKVCLCGCAYVCTAYV